MFAMVFAIFHGIVSVNDKYWFSNNIKSIRAPGAFFHGK